MKPIEWITEHSLMNCHAQGVDSLVLDESPMRRIFVATRGHSLYQNTVLSQFSVGFHPHHCDVTLRRLKGHPLNVHPNILQGTGSWYKYEWESPILGKEGKFKRADENVHGWNIQPIFRSITTLSLRSLEYHTIFVEREAVAAWEVIEGEEDPNFIPYCLSNSDLTQFDPSRFYLPMPRAKVENYLDWLEIKYGDS